MGAIGSPGDAADVRHRDEELQVDQIEAHGCAAPGRHCERSEAIQSHVRDSGLLRRFAPRNDGLAFGSSEGTLRNLQIVPDFGIGQCAPAVGASDGGAAITVPRIPPCPISIPSSLTIAAIFMLAGFIKGVIGLGLPTVSVSLLAVAMPPGQALAIVIVPAIITNIWQTFVGPYLRDIVRRLWPLMIGTAVGIWLNAGALTGPSARYASIVLGVLLVIYAVTGLRKFSFSVAPGNEKWVGGLVGLVTGVISASSGVQVIPSVPFMQAIGMEKDELVQALGVFFTVATLALGFTLTRAGLVNGATALPGAVAMASLLRRRLPRPSGALAHGRRALSPLVPDRDDLSRPLSRRHRDRKNLFGVSERDPRTRDRRTARRARD